MNGATRHEIDADAFVVEHVDGARCVFQTWRRVGGILRHVGRTIEVKKSAPKKPGEDDPAPFDERRRDGMERAIAMRDDPLSKEIIA
ncbi:MAG: hypothetical protein ACQGVC_18120 [Myxococcota bacterium]